LSKVDNDSPAQMGVRGVTRPVGQWFLASQRRAPVLRWGRGIFLPAQSVSRKRGPRPADDQDVTTVSGRSGRRSGHRRGFGASRADDRRGFGRSRQVESSRVLGRGHALGAARSRNLDNVTGTRPRARAWPHKHALGAYPASAATRPRSRARSAGRPRLRHRAGSPAARQQKGTIYDPNCCHSRRRALPVTPRNPT